MLVPGGASALQRFTGQSCSNGLDHDIVHAVDGCFGLPDKSMGQEGIDFLSETFSMCLRGDHQIHLVE